MIEIDFSVKPKEFTPDYVIDCFGTKFLYDKEGEFHSYNDLPSVISKNEIIKKWHNHGEKHRDNGLPAVVRYDGYQEYWENGIKIK